MPCDEFCFYLFDWFLHLGVWGCFQLVAEGLHHFHLLWKQDCIISICYESRIASFPFAMKAGLHHFHLPWKQDCIISICHESRIASFPFAMKAGLPHFHLPWKQDCIISICHESRIASFPFAMKAGLHHFHLPWKQDWIIPICHKRIMTAFFRYTYSSEQKCKCRLCTDCDVKGTPYHVCYSFELHGVLE